MAEPGLRSWWTRLTGPPAVPVIPAPVPGVSLVQTSVFTVALRSSRPAVAFDATFQLRWQGQNTAAYWRARADLERFADEIAARYCVTESGNAENSVNLELAGSWAHTPREGIRVFSAGVNLRADADARRTAEQMLEIDRQAAVERLRQQAELQRLRHLREDIYSRPAVARSYWLQQHPDSLDRMLAINFEGIAATFGDVSGSRFIVIAKLVEDFIGGLDDGGRRFLVERLDAVFTSYGRPDLAGQLSEPAE